MTRRKDIYQARIHARKRENRDEREKPFRGEEEDGTGRSTKMSTKDSTKDSMKVRKVKDRLISILTQKKETDTEEEYA